MKEGETAAALTELFKKFPGIGQRQAQRFTDFIAGTDGRYIRDLTGHIAALQRTSKQCPQCYIRYESNTPTCEVCALENPDTLIIVEKDIDARSLYDSITPEMNAHYFILGGLIPIANDDESRVRLLQMTRAVRSKRPKEIIIALSVHPDADHTARHLTNRLKKEFPNIAVTTLGRGLSTGSELEYSDPDTLENALNNRGTL